MTIHGGVYGKLPPRARGRLGCRDGHPPGFSPAGSPPGGGEGEEALAVPLGRADAGQQGVTHCVGVGDAQLTLEGGGGDGDAGPARALVEAQDVAGGQSDGGRRGQGFVDAEAGAGSVVAAAGTVKPWRSACLSSQPICCSTMR